MTLSQSFFIPLYFDEAEAELWLALQRIEPEKRSAFIKTTLRQVLINKDEAEALNTHFLEHNIEEIDNVEEIDDLETFSLEALFAEVHVLDLDAEYVGLAVHAEAKPSSLKGPWDYLLHTVIGVEEDEAVIAAFKQTVHSEVQEEKPDNLPMKIISELPVDEPDGLLDRVGDQEFDVESLRVDTPLPSTGFEYMMKHIIGTEEDEVVLKILRGGPEAKFEVRSSNFDSK